MLQEEGWREIAGRRCRVNWSIRRLSLASVRKQIIYEQLTRRIAISLAPRSHHCPPEGCRNRHNLTSSIASARLSIPATINTTIIIIIICPVSHKPHRNYSYKVSRVNLSINVKSYRGNHTAMDQFTEEDFYRVKNNFIYLSKPTAAPNISNRARG
jgi:hypothetical protein